MLESVHFADVSCNDSLKAHGKRIRSSGKSKNHHLSNETENAGAAQKLYNSCHRERERETEREREKEREGERERGRETEREREGEGERVTELLDAG